MQLTDKDGNVFGIGGLEITTSDGKPKIPVINTDITIGVTSIVGGVAGRVLFEGAGNVVQESANFFWDNTNGRLGINTSIPSLTLDVVGTHVSGTGIARFTGNANAGFMSLNTTISGESGFLMQSASTLIGQVGVDGTTNMLYLKNRVFGTSNIISLSSLGNVLINTTTDAGFKLDVNGSSTFRGEIRLNANIATGGNRNYLLGNSGDFEVTTNTNIKFRNFYNASDVYFSMNYGSGGRALFSGLTSANGYRLATSGNVIPEATVARGVFFNNTLVAAANNNVLVGLDVQPTFTNGAFTGVSNFAARFGGDTVFTHGNRSIRVLSPTSGNGGSLSITSGSATTSGTGGDIYLNVGSGAGGPGPGRIYLGNNNGWDVCYVRGLLTINNSGPNTGSAFQVNAGGQNGLTIFWDNLTPYMAYGLVSGRQSRFVNSTSYTFSSKVFIGTNTDAGFTFDVNGSARVQNGLTVSGSLNLNSSDISSAWIAYTPTWSTDGATQPSLGNGTITGTYKVIGKTVFVRVRLVFGTTTTAGTGTFYFSLPVNAAIAWGVQMPASILDNGFAWYQATVNGEYGGLTDRVALIGQSPGGANSSQSVTAVFPVGFGNLDSIQFGGSYESI